MKHSMDMDYALTKLASFLDRCFFLKIFFLKRQMRMEKTRNTVVKMTIGNTVTRMLNTEGGVVAVGGLSLAYSMVLGSSVVLE